MSELFFTAQIKAINVYNLKSAYVQNLLFTRTYMSVSIKSVVIVGGGTAGWITAGVLSAKLIEKFGANANGAPIITLIESDKLAPIGVGEGTLPTMRSTLASMGISESTFIKECNASFKQGSTFRKWRTNESNDVYQHPFSLPAEFSTNNLAEYWLSNAEVNEYQAFANFVTPQAKVCEQKLAPKQSTTPEFAAVCNYGYHLDAGEFSNFLRTHCIENLQVRHVVDEVINIDNHPNGHIKSVTTKSSGVLEGQLFIDCTGISALLIGKHLGVGFISKKDTLFIDSAVAAQADYVNSHAPIESNTLSTAQAAGWIWDIGLPSRRGIGYAYSSQFASRDLAEETLQDYIQHEKYALPTADCRHISFEPGHRERFWSGNCVAIGLSAGFVEPLEASSLALVELSCKMIAEQFPASTLALPQLEKRFNEVFLYRWQRIVEFLKLHYVLSQRADSAFWVQNKDPKSVPERLKEMLDGWKYQAPWHYDFDRIEIFPSASYQYILCGMGYAHALSGMAVSNNMDAVVARLTYANKSMSEKYLSALPTNRELIEKIKQKNLPI